MLRKSGRMWTLEPDIALLGKSLTVVTKIDMIFLMTVITQQMI
jgi:hypothetical protein